MAKTTFAGLKMTVNNKMVEVHITDDKSINVLQYLPIADKHALVTGAIAKADVNGIIDDILLDLYFNLYIVYMYTDLVFTEKQREDEFKLYDVLTSNGVVDKVIEAIPESEYDSLVTWIESICESTIEHRHSTVSLLQSVINDLPKNAEAAAKIVDQFDPEKFQEVIKFAEAANGNRPIPKVVK